MATGRVPTTANSPLTAKGDLFTYSTAPARLAVGNNGESLVADSAATTGLRYQETNAAGKNFVINGGFDVWQRATASTALPTTIAYSTADRWGVVQDSTSAGTSSQATSSMPAGFRYAIQLQRNLSSTSTNPIRMYQILETQNSIPAQGKVLTFSFWAKAGANYSSASSALNLRVSTGTGTDQSVTNLPAGSLTGYAEVVTSSITVTTSWQKFTVTSSTVSSSATQIGFVFFWTPAGTAGANDWVQITGVQLEIGSVATGFQRAMGTLQGELAACQRYYFRQSGITSNYTVAGNGFASSTTVFKMQVKNPVNLRTIATSIDANGVFGWDGANLPAMSALTLEFATETYSCFSATGSSLTANRPYALLLTYPGAYIGFSAEL